MRMVNECSYDSEERWYPAWPSQTTDSTTRVSVYEIPAELVARYEAARDTLADITGEMRGCPEDPDKPTVY